jgi:hypothetical protein
VRAFIRTFRLLLVSLLFCAVKGQPAHAATPGAQAFEQGIQAFHAGNYQGALQSFIDARQAGLDTPALRYDLGATYYRLGRYAEAELEFQALARDPGWSPLAHYNLGLTAQRMDRGRQATEHFEQAQRTTTDPSLRALAATALERLGRAAPAQRTSTLVSLAGGYDSNVTLSQDAATVGASHRSDSFVETFAAASHRLSENTARGWVAHGGLVVRKYSDLHQFDLAGLRAGLSHETDSGGLQTSVGGYFDTVYIGGGRLEQVAMADAQARIRLDAGGELRERYQLGRIAGGGGFEYLDGWQQRLSADAGFALGAGFVRVGYQLELNNRRDLQQGTDFFSASPTRHSLFASVALRELGGWQSEARGEYRVSRYNDPDRRDGVEVTRKDHRYGLALRATRPLGGPWRAFVDTSYYRDESNLDIYDFSRHQLMLGIEAVLGK